MREEATGDHDGATTLPPTDGPADDPTADPGADPDTATVPAAGRRPSALAAAVAISPLVVAAAVLAFRPWSPTLDMAMTELRVRDVGGPDTPLIGLPGRIGVFPDQGSHPGPLSFWLVAPFYRLAGARAWGLELGSVVLNSIVVALAVWVGARLGRRHPGVGATRGALVIAAVMAVAVRGYGLGVLTHPWNPYFPVLIWLLVLLAAWAVLAGDARPAWIVVGGSTVAAQTHVPYLLNGVAICALVLGVLVWRWWRAAGDERRAAGRALLGPLALGALAWVPPVLDQLLRDPGNIRMLYHHFAGDPPEPAIALGTAVRVFLRHLDAWSMSIDLLRHRAAFVHRSGLPDGSGWGGLVVLAVWLAAVAAAWRRRHASLLAAHAVVAVALAVQLVSISRIFGKVWYYLTLWAWGTLLVLLSAVTATVAVEVRSRRPPRDDEASGRARHGRWVEVTAAVVLAVTSAASLGATVAIEVPEPQLSDGLRAVVPATVAAIERGDGAAVGRDGRYVVFWQDAAYNGSQGYGMVNELERRGFDVGVHPTWRVPVTPHRVMADGSYDAEIHVVTGEFIDEWRTRDGYVEVVDYDRRTDEERGRFATLRDRVVARLTEIGRDDLLESVDRNLFGASLAPDLPQDVVDDLSEMLLLSVPIAVFIAPAGSTF